MQGRFVLRLAKKLVERSFNLSQRGAKFVNHTSHRLTITHATVQVLHPSFQWLRLTTVAHMLKSAGQLLTPILHLRVSRIQILVGGLQIQDGSRDLHGDCRCRRLAGAQSDVNRT